MQGSAGGTFPPHLPVGMTEYGDKAMFDNPVAALFTIGFIGNVVGWSIGGILIWKRRRGTYRRVYHQPLRTHAELTIEKKVA